MERCPSASQEMTNEATDKTHETCLRKLMLTKYEKQRLLALLGILLVAVIVSVVATVWLCNGGRAVLRSHAVSLCSTAARGNKILYFTAATDAKDKETEAERLKEIGLSDVIVEPRDDKDAGVVYRDPALEGLARWVGFCLEMNVAEAKDVQASRQLEIRWGGPHK